MKKVFIRTDSFALKKHRLRIYRVAEPGSAVLLWMCEQQAAAYVQHIHIQKLLVLAKRL